MALYYSLTDWKWIRTYWISLWASWQVLCQMGCKNVYIIRYWCPLGDVRAARRSWPNRKYGVFHCKIKILVEWEIFYLWVVTCVNYWYYFLARWVLWKRTLAQWEIKSHTNLWFVRGLLFYIIATEWWSMQILTLHTSHYTFQILFVSLWGKMVKLKFYSNQCCFHYLCRSFFCH